MSAKRTTTVNRKRDKQRGAALMIMLIIMIVGVAAIFVSSLNSSSLNIERGKITADALAQAKDALIGYAVSDPNRPGELPCPDYNNDGMITTTDDYSGSDCKSLIGRLPWHGLGLPDLRDGSGERLWYALSDPFHANGANVLNSDTTGDLTVSGSTMANNVIAIVFAPGDSLPGQSRSPTQNALCATTSTTLNENLCATNYLEGSNANLNQPATPNTNYQTDAASATFNDQAIFITHEQLFPGVEMRIAREAKSCLDGYALTSAGKYPWAAPVSDTTNYFSLIYTLFGRLPVQPGIRTNTTTGGDPVLVSLVEAITAVEIALSNFVANANASTASALSIAGSTLTVAADTSQNSQPTKPELVNNITNQIDQTGDHAIKLANNQGGLTVADLQFDIDIAKSNLTGAGVNLNVSDNNDNSMSLGWAAGCNITTADYWDAWKNLIFYQVADGYQPGKGASCINCLSITGSGNTAGGSGSYRAVVLVARRPINGQTYNPFFSDTYLEGSNRHQTSPGTAFEAYNPADPNFANVNDLVLCLDGRNNCK